MCSCHSILECCVTFSGVKLSIRSFVLLLLLLLLGALLVLRRVFSTVDQCSTLEFGFLKVKSRL